MMSFMNSRFKWILILLLLDSTLFHQFVQQRSLYQLLISRLEIQVHVSSVSQHVVLPVCFPTSVGVPCHLTLPDLLGSSMSKRQCQDSGSACYLLSSLNREAPRKENQMQWGHYRDRFTFLDCIHGWDYIYIWTSAYVFGYESKFGSAMIR